MVTQCQHKWYPIPVMDYGELHGFRCQYCRKDRVPTSLEYELARDAWAAGFNAASSKPARER